MTKKMRERKKNQISVDEQQRRTKNHKTRMRTFNS